VLEQRAERDAGLHNTPIGPTGAAIEKPIGRSLSNGAPYTSARFRRIGDVRDARHERQIG
jgi:hypothetical protein